MRTYTFEDVQELLTADRVSDYVWEVNDAKKASGKNLGYYIIGYPIK